MEGRSFASLEEFAEWFLSSPLDRSKTPKLGGVYSYGSGLVSVVLFREGQFQVELFVMAHAAGLAESHRHPDVDTLEVHLCGDLQFTVRGKPVYSDRFMKALLKGRFGATPPIHISPNDYHGGHSNTGAAFLSIQQWRPGVDPTSVGLNWDGAVATPEHAALLGRTTAFPANESWRDGGVFLGGIRQVFREVADGGRL